MIKKFRPLAVTLALIGSLVAGGAMAAAPAAADVATLPGCRAIATANTAQRSVTTWMDFGAGSCAPGVSGRYLPPGAPATMPPIETPITWGAWNATSVTRHNIPANLVGPRAHLR